MSRLSTWIVPRVDKNLGQIVPSDLTGEKPTAVWTTLEDGSGSDSASEANSVNIKGWSF